MNQKELFNQFKFECDLFKDYSAVIQNEFKDGLSEDEAKTFIKESSERFEYQADRLRDLKLQIEKFIWSQIKEQT